ncbi:MAG: RNA chaperone Hfq, partial [Oscillospiraceae bacterium]|nr:RNA chaperone Hfq [Oscillospiraceae bacterium]
MSLTSTVSVTKQPNIQDAFLSAARRLAARVTVFLMNGYQMRGIITAFEPYDVVVVSDGKHAVIY